MASFLQVFILIPILGFIVLLLIPEKKEMLISWTCFVFVGSHFIIALGFLIFWLLNGYPTLNLKDIVLLHMADYEFLIDFYFDKISAVYLFVGSVLTFLVTVYSRYYLHREEGYKRFFATILFFYIGYNTTIFSGNFETLFIGWEILGISSFLLIAFYRNKYLPVRNAVKVFSVYRIGDVGLLLAMWMSHHLWHENITFLTLGDYALVHEHLQTHSLIGVFISLMILASASAKSAQLPFSSWLPRAMEGPTPSSAIFYGSLAVHLGVFLLLRTFPFWEQQISVRIFIAVLGLSTTIVSTGIARVQSSIKAQIAYASIAQIGLMFIEVAAGFEALAMFHFAGNAFLRTYQLLVSPSVVSYLIREQFYTFYPPQRSMEDFLPKKLAYTFYMLGIKEWNLDSLMYRYFWNPLKWIGNRLDFLTLKGLSAFFVPVYLIGLFCLYNQGIIPTVIRPYLPVAFSFMAVIMVLKSFTERKRARVAWLLTIMNHFFVVLAISFNETFNYSQGLLSLSGVFVAGGVGFICLSRLKSIEKSLNLQQFHGYSRKHPKLAFLFLLACLGVSGFPITPTFIGEDLMFSHIHEHQLVLAFFTSLSFIIDGLAIIRIYARIFLGPYEKSMYEMAYRSY